MIFKFMTTNEMTLDEIIRKYHFVVCLTKTSRIKAKDLAVREAMMVLNKREAVFLPNGPLSDFKGSFIILVPKDRMEGIEQDLDLLGYSNRYLLLDFEYPQIGDETNLNITSFIWKKRPFGVKELFVQNEEKYIAHSADNRLFKILDFEGKVKDVNGYRGDGKEIGRRALPVEDSKILINLAMPQEEEKLLDPFAGGGGIIFEARQIQGLKLFSNDIDPVVSPGLESYGANHTINDIRDLSYEDESFDVIVTEVPFAYSTTQIVCEGISRLTKILRYHGRMSIMCGEGQAEEIAKRARVEGLLCYSRIEVDRKGTPVVIFAFTKSYELWDELCLLNKQTENIVYKGQKDQKEDEFP